ncbi:MAG: non-canonical purine NTP pyrophosphatase, RdgB/HAM1 family [Kordiimonas sp.]|nr:non-canonical purine NTP pyrophosphatase, RdgB/HAM1 family [Kordiimonas sp.]
MTRLFREKKLVVASHNAGKVREISALMQPFGVETVSAGDLGLPEPDETGTTFIANAELKARAAAMAAGVPALSDDSGLVVPALDGQPGIYSARWAVDPATGQRDFTYGMEKLHRALEEKGAVDRRAYFVCALSLAWPDGHVESFEGRVWGELVWPIRGTRGFGYDPQFQADGYDITFGEMDPAEKHSISHRAVAFHQLIEACFAAQ